MTSSISVGRRFDVNPQYRTYAAEDKYDWIR